MMIDTSILVDYFRGKEQARDFILSADKKFRISRVSFMELIHGVSSHAQLAKVKKQIKVLSIDIIEINEVISQGAGELFEGHYHASGLGMMDAFIAATSLVAGEVLATQNIKHFRIIKELECLKPY